MCRVSKLKETHYPYKSPNYSVLYLSTYSGTSAGALGYNVQSMSFIFPSAILAYLSSIAYAWMDPPPPALARRSPCLRVHRYPDGKYRHGGQGVGM